MNNKCLLAAAAVSIAMLAQTADAAKGFNYTFAELGYRYLDSDSGDADGIEANFSFGATDYIHVVGSYTRFNVDDVEGLSNVDIDVDEFTIGFGGHYPVTDKIDVVGTARYVDQEFSGDASLGGSKTRVKFSEEGYDVNLAARIQAMKKLELEPHYVFEDVGSDSDNGLGLGVIYKFHKKFSVSFRGTYFEDDSETDLFLGVRLDM